MILNMSTMKKTKLYDVEEDDFISVSQTINDYEDGNVIVDFFSRHNTLEEYMKLLNETFKKERSK